MKLALLRVSSISPAQIAYNKCLKYPCTLRVIVTLVAVFRIEIILESFDVVSISLQNISVRAEFRKNVVL